MGIPVPLSYDLYNGLYIIELDYICKIYSQSLRILHLLPSSAGSSTRCPIVGRLRDHECFQVRLGAFKFKPWNKTVCFLYILEVVWNGK